jgi:hypothetical protein
LKNGVLLWEVEREKRQSNTNNVFVWNKSLKVSGENDLGCVHGSVPEHELFEGLVEI